MVRCLTSACCRYAWTYALRAPATNAGVRCTLTISNSRRKKTVYLLVGAKGSGKTYIGDLLERSLGIEFIRVEQRAIEHLDSLPLDTRQLINDGFELELKWIEDALLTSDEVVSEATGSSKYLPWFLDQISEKYDLKLIRVVCPLEVCFDRVKRRSNIHHHDVSDEKLREINAASHNAKLDWTLEIDNTDPASDNQILQELSALRLRR